MLLEEFIKPSGLTQVEVAERLGVSYPRLNELIHGKRGVTPDTALRLERLFGMAADFWLNLQRDRDLWDALQSNQTSKQLAAIDPLERAAAERGEPTTNPAVRESEAPPYTAGQGFASPLTLVDRDALAAVCHRHHIRRLAVFGSRARGDAQPDSDVDVVVEFEPGMTPGLGMETVAEALQPVLGGRRVDLVTQRGLSPRLREHILATAVPLYAT